MKISAIIPAYNEENRIHNVLKVLKETPNIHEIIVVSDGSTDRTPNVAQKYTSHVIKLEENIGKGGAIITGINYCDADVILLLDADLIGLTSKHIMDLLNPVIYNEADTSIGVFSSGRLLTDIAQKITPFLSGQRVIKREIANDIHNLDITKYGFEVALSKYIRRKGLKIKKVMLNNMTHVMKEEKLGIRKGLLSRIKMYWQIIKALSIIERQ